MDWLDIKNAPKDGRPKWVRGYFNRGNLRYAWAYWDPIHLGWYEAGIDGRRLQPTQYCRNPQ